MKNVDFNSNIQFSSFNQLAKAGPLVAAALLANKNPFLISNNTSIGQLSDAVSDSIDHVSITGSSKTGGCCDSH